MRYLGKPTVAAVTRWLQAAGLADLQQAGGWRSPTTAALYVGAEWARRGPVARRRYGVGQ